MKDKVQGLVRTLIATIGGGAIASAVSWASAQGVEISEDGVAALAAGLVMVAVSAIWSWLSKKRIQSVTNH